jgi:hypothetical protein
MKLDRNEVARYLGYGTSPLSTEIETLVSQCEGQLLKGMLPRHLGRRLALSELPSFDSRDLGRHLQNCKEVWLIVVTLGSEADRLLRVWSAQHIGKAAVGQACAATLMDQCCDEYLSELEQKLSEGEYLLPPYSPGYGDFSLSWQGALLHLLDAGRRIGVSLTEGGMLVPEKTVTAVVGITNAPTERCKQSCLACEKKDCQFRKGS